jgi:hypothetical protein
VFPGEVESWLWLLLGNGRKRETPLQTLDMMMQSMESLQGIDYILSLDIGQYLSSGSGPYRFSISPLHALPLVHRHVESIQIIFPAVDGLLIIHTFQVRAIICEDWSQWPTTNLLILSYVRAL